ncbi:hypothetical protein ABQJ54_01455 [Rhodanobacter sp. Si-c]|uniref:HEAT repeat domain-containing protein n=1 Tax=Rhodanobacter lycopersici TaxID=3162487 RepID=A0ABV3Q9D3_9GAMM
MPAFFCPRCLVDLGLSVHHCPWQQAEIIARRASPEEAARAFRWIIDDYANHAVAAECIACAGTDAIEPLCRYLAEGPQANPQGRLFAAAMLARLSSPAALAGLRDVLHGSRLHGLPASQHEAEYQVKNMVLERLAERDYPERSIDIAFGVQSERLPAAVAAAGRHGSALLAPDFVAMLRDDVLERVARDALADLGDAGASAILVAGWDLLDEEPINVRSRLALVRAFLVLERLHVRLPLAMERRTAHAHPAVSAAATLLMDVPDPSGVERLLHGALSEYLPLSQACRARLQCGGAGVVELAHILIRQNVERDIYGNTHALSKEAVTWLTQFGH